jgi:uncharacterized protein YciI
LSAGGAQANPVDEALLIFTDKDEATRFTKNDPYVVNGLVEGFTLRELSCVAGSVMKE